MRAARETAQRLRGAFFPCGWDAGAAEAMSGSRSLVLGAAWPGVDVDMGLTLWLPSDDETLEERTMALSQWCSGFLAGVGSSGDDVLETLSDDGKEALKDLQQVSLADVTDTDQSEEDEIEQRHISV